MDKVKVIDYGFFNHDGLAFEYHVSGNEEGEALVMLNGNGGDYRCFEGDLYGKIAKIHLVDFIRGEVKFGGVEELKFAISKDKKTAAQILKNF